MLQAQLHGKIPTQEFAEDVMTSDIFGSLDYLNRYLVWRKFAGDLLDISLTREQSERTDFE